MGLSRLDNFLKSVRGTILYVDPNSIDATDSVENQGNSLTRPFKTIQRALIEAARFSYQSGLDNDRFAKTTILLYPGDHIVDNRPGYIPDGANNYRLRSGLSTNDFPPFDLTTNFDINTENNQLYKFNSIYGGVIVPRGTSIVGMDLRKTAIRPKYVPDPENSNIERSALFRVTGGCYFWQFSIFDASPTGTCYKDYTGNVFVPNFSHHKLTSFEYADGVNKTDIDDDFMTYYSDRTDLDMYYEKVGLAYGQSSGRDISPDYPSAAIDIQPKIDEYRIVGSKGAQAGISSIRAGDGSTSTTTIRVTLDSNLTGLDVDTPIRIQGVGSDGYDGQHVISEVVSSGTTFEFEYEVQNPPVNALPSVSGATLNISVDTVTSASPYIFNVSMRSVFGMCGLHADGNKATGFKSMVVAQFTGIGLQKDSNAFVKYNTTTGTYDDNTAIANLPNDSGARYKPAYENFHIKCSNDSILQVVSVFAIGFSEHFVAETGGDQSITNSNSNFGSRSLVSSGFKKTAFGRDDVGYVTHVLPPKVIDTDEVSIEYLSIDVGVTTSVGISSHLYLYNQTNEDIAPDGVIQGYRVGAKVNDTLNTLINQSGSTSEYSATIVMPNTSYSTSEKNFTVGRSSVGVNSITSSTITLTDDHSFENGETIRIIADNGHLPDGLDTNQIYFAITTGVNADQIKVAQTLNDAGDAEAIIINNKGGILSVVSRVSDKIPGDTGHPIRFDSTNGQWYVNVATAATANTIYSTLSNLGTASLGEATSRTFIKRTPDTRNIIDTTYRLRYVIPADSATTARPPLDGYVLQESNTSIGSTSTEVAYQFNPNGATLSNSTDLRNPRIIADASWSSNTASIVTELPHDLKTGAQVEIVNITSSNNTTGIANSAFNGTFTVTGISSAKQFSVALTDNPGTFTNDTSERTTSLPNFKKKQYVDSYYIYRSQEIQKYVAGEKDGIYHLIVVNTSNSPTVAPFTNERFSQPIQNLYPQLNRDNPKSDAKRATSFAVPDTIGQVVINEPQNSITKEGIEKKLVDTGVGFGITNIYSASAVGTSHTIHSEIDHGLNPVTTLTIANAGTGYGVGSGNTEYYYNANLVGYAGSTTGANATARVTVSAAGSITDVTIMDGGSSYGIGNTMSVVGIATTTGHSAATVTVAKIIDNVGDTVSITGIAGTTSEQYNNIYRITEVASSTVINVASASTISTGSTTGLGSTISAGANVILTGRSIDVSSLAYNNVTGIATITTSQNHGLSVNNSVNLSGANSDLYNGTFVVTKNVGLTTFFAKIGITTTIPATSGTIRAQLPGFVPQGGNVTNANENLVGRFVPTYAGITTTISSAVTASATGIGISNVTDFNLQIGDYLKIDAEIVRIKTNVSGNPVSVFRGLLGTKKTSHVEGSVVRKIKPHPVEFRRNSVLRASAHTFEYVGFGPGNYSTALPERQDKTITPQEELLSQAVKKDSGVVVFTGMNDQGDFYVGNKKANSTTGQEQVFDAPVPTVTGEEPESGVNIGFDVLTPLEISISRSLRVEGGPNSDVISEFDGPLVINNKLTSTSTKGIEANSLFLQGDRTVARKYTVGIATPSLAGNPGDVVYNGTPSDDAYIGWTYTTGNEWKKFGYIGDVNDQVGVSSGGSFVGMSTLIDFRAGVGATVTSAFDSASGISTITFDSSPLNVGVSTGSGLTKAFAGIATEINFIGIGLTVGAEYNATGIASITFTATSGAGGTASPGLPLNSVQYNENGFFKGDSDFTFDGTNIFVRNSVGIDSSNPGAKLDIVSGSSEALRIRSTSGSGNIVRVDNVGQDTTPFIIDVDGSVGINTVTASEALDVRGNVSVAGTILFQDISETSSEYIGLQAPATLSSNYTLTLPTVVGAANSLLRTNGSGVLDWQDPTTIVTDLISTSDDLTEGSTNLYFTFERSQDATGSMVTAGIQTGITVTYDDVSNTLNYNVTAASPNPFLTRGFNIPL